MSGIHPLRKLVIAGALALALCIIHFGWYVEALAERDVLEELNRVRASGAESLQSSIQDITALRASISTEERALTTLRERIRATPDSELLGDEFLRVLKREGGRIERMTPGNSEARGRDMLVGDETLFEEKFELVFTCAFESLVRCLRTWESLGYAIRLEKVAIARGGDGELNVELICSSLRAGRPTESRRP